MLFMLKANIAKPANVSNKELYSGMASESEAALGAVKAGAIKGIWKVAGGPIILAVIDSAERRRSRPRDSRVANLEARLCAHRIRHRSLAARPY